MMFTPFSLLQSLAIACLFALSISTLRADDFNFGEDGTFLNQFVIQLSSGGREVADDIANTHGFVVRRELPNIGAYILEHPSVSGRARRSADDHLQLLAQDRRIKHVQQEVALTRVKRKIYHDKQEELPIRTIDDDSKYVRYERPASGLVQRDGIVDVSVQFSDPKFKDMWYLINGGQSGGEEGLDMNMAPVWFNGYTGKGVVVCILDDGIDHRHPDLVDNYDPKASANLNDKHDAHDPMPDTSDSYNSHGTRCAGEIAAAANNDVCGVGVAYEASIGGIKLLDGVVTDSLEAEALAFNRNYVDIYSASWGPSDDGRTMESPKKLVMEALREGVKKGRNGLGSIYVWATGNGGMNGDDCNADGYVSRTETLSVGSVNDWGHSPFFMENCSSTLVVVPSGGEDYLGQEDDNGKVKLKVVTTDMNGGCIENFQGTSSAAPLAAGCLANVLQANPELTWRDVQHLVIHGARVPSVDHSWTINGAGHHVSHRFGFGLMDCGRMVQLAQSWDNVPQKIVCSLTKENNMALNRDGHIIDHLEINGCPGTNGKSTSSVSIDRLEHVQVVVKMSTQRRGNTAIKLVSPAGTRSSLLSPRSKDEYEGEWSFTFMTVHNWDENSRGLWTLEIHDHPAPQQDDDRKSSKTSDMWHNEKGSPGYIKEWTLILHGTHGDRRDRDGYSSPHTAKQEAQRPSESRMTEIKKREMEQARNVHVKRADVEVKDGRKRGKSESVEDQETEDLVRRLWDVFHNKRHWKVESKRKRTYQAKVKKTNEIKQLANEILELLEKRNLE